MVLIFTTRLSSRKGSGRSSTPLTMLKMAVLAEMPSAIVSTAIAVNPGAFSSVRIEYRMLVMENP